MKIKNHTNLLNELAKEINAETYLEIGVSNRVKNFDKISVQFKIGVDPDPKSGVISLTSDDFFELNEQRFDLIFIDGLHSYDQVKRDFLNSLAYLTENGMIVIHDTFPDNSKVCNFPRDVKGRWLGDVYRFIPELNNLPVSFKTYPWDNGCTLVWIDKDIEKKNLMELPKISNYQDFLDNQEFYNVDETW